MRIAIIAHCLHPIAEPFAGGLEMITFLLCKALMGRGHTVDLYAHPASDRQFNLYPIRTGQNISDALRSEMIGSGQNTRSLQELLGYSSVMTDIMDRRYDVIHNHSLHYIPILMGNQLSVPFITTVHTPMFPYLRLGAIGTHCGKKQTFTMVSKSLANTWREYIPVSEVVHNGIDIDKWQFRTHPSGDYVIWYGRICPEKGTALAIRAAILSNTPILVAGPESNGEYFKKEIVPLLSHRLVKFVGHKVQSELMPMIANAKAMLFTSTWEEPFGLTLIESLACGTPVIAFEGGATREILTDRTGYIVPKNDVMSLSKAILKVTSLSRYECRDRALDLFSHEVMVDRYVSLYERLMAKNDLPILESI